MSVVLSARGVLFSAGPTWSEDRGRGELYERAGLRCEITGRSLGSDGLYGEASHRVRRGPGSWSPSNLLRLHWSVHQWLHANPGLARAGGWHLPAVGVVDPSMRRCGCARSWGRAGSCCWISRVMVVGIWW